MSAAFFWFLVLLMAFGTPVVFALLLGPGLSLLIDGETQYFPALLARFYNGIDSFPLLAVPFFILAGEIMMRGGISERLIGLASALVGRMRGGLGQVRQRRRDQIAHDHPRTGVTVLPARDEIGGEHGGLAMVTEQTATNMEECFHVGY